MQSLLLTLKPVAESEVSCDSYNFSKFRKSLFKIYDSRQGIVSNEDDDKTAKRLLENVIEIMVMIKNPSRSVWQELSTSLFHLLRMEYPAACNEGLDKFAERVSKCTTNGEQISSTPDSIRLLKIFKEFARVFGDIDQDECHEYMLFSEKIGKLLSILSKTPVKIETDEEADFLVLVLKCYFLCTRNGVPEFLMQENVASTWSALISSAIKFKNENKKLSAERLAFIRKWGIRCVTSNFRYLQKDSESFLSPSYDRPLPIKQFTAFLRSQVLFVCIDSVKDMVLSENLTSSPKVFNSLMRELLACLATFLHDLAAWQYLKAAVSYEDILCKILAPVYYWNEDGSPSLLLQQASELVSVLVTNWWSDFVPPALEFISKTLENPIQTPFFNVAPQLFADLIVKLPADSLKHCDTDYLVMLPARKLFCEYFLNSLPNKHACLPSFESVYYVLQRFCASELFVDISETRRVLQALYDATVNQKLTNVASSNLLDVELARTIQTILVFAPTELSPSCTDMEILQLLAWVLKVVGNTGNDEVANIAYGLTTRHVIFYSEGASFVLTAAAEALEKIFEMCADYVTDTRNTDSELLRYMHSSMGKALKSPSVKCVRKLTECVQQVVEISCTVLDGYLAENGDIKILSDVFSSLYATVLKAFSSNKKIVAVSYFANAFKALCGLATRLISSNNRVTSEAWKMIKAIANAVEESYSEDWASATVPLVCRVLLGWASEEKDPDFSPDLHDLFRMAMKLIRHDELSGYHLARALLVSCAKCSEAATENYSMAIQEDAFVVLNKCFEQLSRDNLLTEVGFSGPVETQICCLSVIMCDLASRPMIVLDFMVRNCLLDSYFACWRKIVLSGWLDNRFKEIEYSLAAIISILEFPVDALDVETKEVLPTLLEPTLHLLSAIPSDYKSGGAGISAWAVGCQISRFSRSESTLRLLGDKSSEKVAVKPLSLQSMASEKTSSLSILNSNARKNEAISESSSLSQKAGGGSVHEQKSLLSPQNAAYFASPSTSEDSSKHCSHGGLSSDKINMESKEPRYLDDCVNCETLLDLVNWQKKFTVVFKEIKQKETQNYRFFTKDITRDLKRTLDIVLIASV